MGVVALGHNCVAVEAVKLDREAAQVDVGVGGVRRDNRADWNAMPSGQVRQGGVHVGFSLSMTTVSPTVLQCNFIA